MFTLDFSNTHYYALNIKWDLQWKKTLTGHFFFFLQSFRTADETQHALLYPQCSLVWLPRLILKTGWSLSLLLPKQILCWIMVAHMSREKHFSCCKKWSPHWKLSVVKRGDGQGWKNACTTNSQLSNNTVKLSLLLAVKTIFQAKMWMFFGWKLAKNDEGKKRRDGPVLRLNPLFHWGCK